MQLKIVLANFEYKKFLGNLYHIVVYYIMLKLTTKWFRKWTKKNSVSNKMLLQTIKNIDNNFNAISLGSNLFKVRISKQGKGKSSGYRTLVVYRK